MKKIVKVLGIMVLLPVVALFIYNIILSFVYRNPYEEATLSKQEVSDLEYIHQLKSKHGENVWPGFGKSDIPIIVFNDRYEFLQGMSPLEEGWDMVDESGEERKIFRRIAGNPQAFAVPVDQKWVASIGTTNHMNREFFFGIKKEVPKAIGSIFPFFVFKVTPEMHISGSVHEMFHAFEAMENEAKFLASEDTHAALDDYPYNDSKFSDYWNQEGQWLAKALKAENRQDFLFAVDSFLYIRNLRRNECQLQDKHIEAEKGLEWLEGLAKYCEYRSYVLAAGDDPVGYNFKKRNAYWQREQNDRLRRMGNHGGDNRFYHSGAAQAFILDRLNPQWKDEIMADYVYQEDLIRKYRKQQMTSGEKL